MSVGSKVKFEADTIILNIGEASKELFIINYGKVLIFKEEKGRLFFYPFLKERDFLGQLNIFDGSNNKFGAIALEPTELTSIGSKEIGSVLETCPDWVTEIMTTLSSRLSNVMDIAAEHNVNVNKDLEFVPNFEARIRKILG